MDPATEARLRRALHKLAERYLADPDVSLIDIGLRPEGNRFTEEVVLRIHVRRRWLRAAPGARTEFPNELDGLPVIVMAADYKPQATTTRRGSK